MCGFAGFLLGQPGGLDDPEGLATRMANAIAHRGPDDSESSLRLDFGSIK